MHAVAEMEELPVAEARQGDPDAWEALFRRYQMPLYVYVHEWVRDEQVALDLVQEVFIRAVRHLGTLREDGRLGSWLFGIAHQQAAYGHTLKNTVGAQSLHTVGQTVHECFQRPGSFVSHSQFHPAPG